MEIGHIIQKICELTKIIDKSDEKGIIKARKEIWFTTMWNAFHTRLMYEYDESFQLTLKMIII